MFIFSSNTFCNSIQEDCECQQDKEHFGIMYLALLDIFINNIYNISGSGQQRTEQNTFLIQQLYFC